jgi:hypothetical protein
MAWRKKRRIRSYNLPHLDAQGNLTFYKKLEYVRQRNLEIKFPQFKARQLIPVKNDVPAGAETVKWTTYSGVGMAKIVANYSDDLPLADVQGEENYSKVFTIGNAYRFTLQEVKAAAFSGDPLPTKKASAARRANEERVESLAATGDSRLGLLGLFNQPNATVYTIPAGASTSTTWALKTADEILADLNSIVNTVVNTTNGVEAINTIVMPQNQRTLIQNLRIAPNLETTVEEFFLKNHPDITIVTWAKAKGQGAGATDRIVGYFRDPEYIELNIPQEWEEEPPQPKNLATIVPATSRFGGVALTYPLSMVYADAT